MKPCFVLLALGLLLSCEFGQESDGNDPLELLIKSSDEFVVEDGASIDEEYGSTQQFQQHFFNVEYLQDTIYAEAILSVNVCGDARAAIKINGDTLFLTTQEQKETLCTSSNWHKYHYWIKNPTNKQYIVRQE